MLFKLYIKNLQINNLLGLFLINTGKKWKIEQTARFRKNIKINQKPRKSEIGLFRLWSRCEMSPVISRMCVILESNLVHHFFSVTLHINI